MHRIRILDRASIALAAILVAVALAATAALVATAAPTARQTHTDSWRVGPLALPAAVARDLGLPSGRYELRLAERQPADGSIEAVLLRDGRREPNRPRWTGRPTGCSARDFLDIELQPVLVSNVRTATAGTPPRLLLRSRTPSGCSLLLAPGIEGSPIGTAGTAAPTPGIEGSPIGTAGTSAPPPGLEGTPIGTSGAAAPAPGIEGSDIGSGAVPARGRGGTGAIAGTPAGGDLRCRVQEVLAVAAKARDALPPLAKLPEDLRPSAAAAFRTLDILANSPPDELRLVQTRLTAVDHAAARLMQFCAQGQHIPADEIDRCRLVYRHCQTACVGDALCACSPELVGCLAAPLRSGSR